MDLISIYLSQLSDIFRIGLVVALLLTAANTSQTLNKWIPLGLGIVFVAVLIPTTFGSGETTFALAFAVGIVSNTTILAAALERFMS